MRRISSFVALRDYLYEKNPPDLRVFFRFEILYEAVRSRYHTSKLDPISLVPQVNTTPLRTNLATNIVSQALHMKSSLVLIIAKLVVGITR